MLHTASFYAPDHWVGQPYRVSRQHPRGRRVQWETLPFLYPERHHLDAYRQGSLTFDQFSREYRAGLELRYASSYGIVAGPNDPAPAQLRAWLESIPALGDFTLLCFEPCGEPCHRLVLARWLLEAVEGLEEGCLR